MAKSSVVRAGIFRTRNEIFNGWAPSGPRPLPPIDGPQMLDHPQDVAARRAANALQSVSRLPLELLCMVFSFALNGVADLPENGYTWIRLFHVCYRWYIAGTNFPRLWTSLVALRERKCMRELIRRSIGHPLDVYINLIKQDPITKNVVKIKWRPRAADQLLKELPRMRTLSLRYAYGFWKPKPPAQSLPMLEQLILNVHYSSIPTGPRGREAFNLPTASPFNVDLPNLKTFTLRLNWNPNGVLRLQNLRFLDIQVLQPPRPAVAHGWDLQEILESLRGMPSLEQLSLDDAINLDSPATLNDIAGPRNPVHLQNLKFLRLVNTGPGIAHFLDRVVVPVETNLRLRAKFCPRDVNDISPFVASLPRTFTTTPPGGTRPEHRVCRSLIVRTARTDGACPERTLQFEGCGHVYDHLAQDARAPAKNTPCRGFFNIQICYLGSDEAWTRQLDGLSEMLTVLPWNKVETLFVEAPETFTGLLVHLGYQMPHSAQIPWKDFVVPHYPRQPLGPPFAMRIRAPQGDGGQLLEELELMRRIFPTVMILQLFMHPVVFSVI